MPRRKPKSMITLPDGKKIRKRTPDKHTAQIQAPIEPIKEKGLKKEEMKILADIVFKDIQLHSDLSLDQKRVLYSIFFNFGNVTASYKQCGISPKFHVMWLHDNQSYKEYYQICQESVIDSVEQALIELAVEERNFSAIKYYLDNKATERGYNKQITNSQDSKDQVQFIISFNGPIGQLPTNQFSGPRPTNQFSGPRSTEGASETQEISCEVVPDQAGDVAGDVDVVRGDIKEDLEDHEDPHGNPTSL